MRGRYRLKAFKIYHWQAWLSVIFMIYVSRKSAQFYLSSVDIEGIESPWQVELLISRVECTIEQNASFIPQTLPTYSSWPLYPNPKAHSAWCRQRDDQPPHDNCLHFICMAKELPFNGCSYISQSVTLSSITTRLISATCRQTKCAGNYCVTKTSPMSPYVTERLH